MTECTPFLRFLLKNLRLSAIIIAVGFAGVGLFALVAQEEISWDIPVFLAVGMLLSSLINAALDAKHEREGLK